MAKQTASDLYMNFVAIEGHLDASDSSDLTEQVINTGLSIRGMLIWLVHLVECFVPMPGTNGRFIEWCLSTRQGLTQMPAVGDDGVIAKLSNHFFMTTSGMETQIKPNVLHYLPPIPIATPQLSLYLIEDTDEAGLRNVGAEARIGFTTTPLDAAVYTEIAETWGW